VSGEPGDCSHEADSRESACHARSLGASGVCCAWRRVGTALGVVEAASELGIGVPNRLSGTGYDDIEAADILGITTVHQPLEEKGRRAVEPLLALIDGKPAGPLKTCCRCDWWSSRRRAFVRLIGTPGDRGFAGAAETAGPALRPDAGNRSGFWSARVDGKGRGG
jgi:hypothetical protein